MAFVFRVISGIGVLIGIAWAIAAPGYEPILACIGAVGVFVSTFMSSAGPAESVVLAEPRSTLSPRATELLAEMDTSTESKVKGISLMLMDSCTGFYRPFIWSNHLHGGISASVGDITDVIAAVSELEDYGFLQLHDSTESLRQYRRTGKQP